MDIWGKIIPGRENSKYKNTEIVEVLGVLKEQQGGHHVCYSVNMGRERKGMKSGFQVPDYVSSCVMGSC